MPVRQEKKREVIPLKSDDIAHAIKMSRHRWSTEKTRGTEILCRANCTPGKLPWV